MALFSQQSKIDAFRKIETQKTILSYPTQPTKGSSNACRLSSKAERHKGVISENMMPAGSDFKSMAS